MDQAPGPKLLPSERWWQEHGGEEWEEEIARRRQALPIYCLQEIFLDHYFARMRRPVKVLEFGCGFGRHLDYLRHLPALEVHGCDQSVRMLAAARRTLGGDDPVASRLTLTQPRQPLPYPDQAFDIAFTVSVLIHVPPEALDFTLTELVRVTRHSLLHIEGNLTEEERLISTIHDGCWGHNLPAAYHRQGITCQVLPRHFEAEDIYRATVAPDPQVEPAVSGEAAARSLALDRIVRELQESRQDDIAAALHDYRRQVRMILDAAT